ncbi:MAG: phosphonate C-P lyase system protein PhnG [Syntrophomonadaceae bacterium]|nr:phosphonate C-P lyase system protein PhnG [Syntrophomonadaceae bacterium]
MNRKQRTEILIRGSADLAGQLAQEILDLYEVSIVEESHHGMVMVKMRESAQRSLFYLGEVLITECKVMINGALGIGMVKGDEPSLARNLAVIDAAYNGNLPETKPWQDILLAEDSHINQENAQFADSILKTKVNFETMNV